MIKIVYAVEIIFLVLCTPSLSLLAHSEQSNSASSVILTDAEVEGKKISESGVPLFDNLFFYKSDRQIEKCMRGIKGLEGIKGHTRSDPVRCIISKLAYRRLLQEDLNRIAEQVAKEESLKPEAILVIKYAMKVCANLPTPVSKYDV